MKVTFKWILGSKGLRQPANIYLFKVKNKNTSKKGVKYVQS